MKMSKCVDIRYDRGRHRWHIRVRPNGMADLWCERCGAYRSDLVRGGER